MLIFGLVIGGLVIVHLLWTGDRREGDRRGRIFDDCAACFEIANISRAPDGFARLTGRVGGQLYALRLIPDSLTLKRLPQLWLSMKLPQRRDQPRIVITARPRPDDFFSDAAGLHHRVEVPSWLPQDLSIRSDLPQIGVWLVERRASLLAMFEDPLVKELSIGPTGLRLIYRLAEGRRGQHLLLRQLGFEANMTKELFARLKNCLLAFDPTMNLEREWAA